MTSGSIKECPAKPHLPRVAAVGVLVLTAVSGTALAGDFDGRAEKRMQRHGARIEHRPDHRANRADRIEHRSDQRAAALGMRGRFHVAARVDHRGERADRQLDQRAQRIASRWERHGDRFDQHRDRDSGHGDRSRRGH